MTIFTKTNYFTRVKYGLRKMHSTELAALELADRILKDVDERNISLTKYSWIYR